MTGYKEHDCWAPISKQIKSVLSVVDVHDFWYFRIHMEIQWYEVICSVITVMEHIEGEMVNVNLWKHLSSYYSFEIPN